VNTVATEEYKAAKQQNQALENSESRVEVNAQGRSRAAAYSAVISDAGFKTAYFVLYTAMSPNPETK
jgi:hypothetical protein